MVSVFESGEVMPHPHHPHSTEALAHIIVDYYLEACRHMLHTDEIDITYDDHGGARWCSCRRYLPDGAVAAAIRALPRDTSGLNYNLYLTSLEGSPNMDEIDFKLLSHDKCTVHTNFHVEGGSGWEQIHQLPFDSSSDFQHYVTAWEYKDIEWCIDGELIRWQERCEGEPMFLYASMWDASHINKGRWTGTYHDRNTPYVYIYREVRVPPIELLVEKEEECQDVDADNVNGDNFNGKSHVPWLML